MRKRRVAALLGAVALAAGLSAGLAGTAHAADPVVPSSTWNEIFAPFDSICMAAGDLSDNNQTPLMSRFCDGFQDAAQILELG